MSETLRARPVGRATNASVGTAGAAFQVPAGRVRQVKVKVDGDAYVGIGPASSAPAAATTNTAYLDANEQEVWTLDGFNDRSAYVYVYAASGTVSARISWYG